MHQAFPLLEVPLQYPPNSFPDRLKATTQYLDAVFGIHEMFHHSQETIFKKNTEDFTDPVFVVRCTDVPSWRQAIETELNGWREIELSLNSMPLKTLTMRIQKIIDRRKANAESDSKAQECWRETEHMERHEGVPNFVNQQAFLTSKLDTISTKNAWNDFAFDLKNQLHPFYYATGALLCEALQRLNRDQSWQQRIEAGRTPASEMVETLNQASCTNGRNETGTRRKIGVCTSMPQEIDAEQVVGPNGQAATAETHQPNPSSSQ